ncbi:hypothetical protein ETD83_08755 [Actinomadura soli]|uniref:Uncharacterized protein n=1 Tax=Actinomadura soli TaxID=2508997 RepID=A0A5C4JFI6_9ACTN|nr:hypothetical protein [Actinomadura soli]TMR04254.1 hypothetical protein ETD83_08755 [Actinomadura soli]
MTEAVSTASVPAPASGTAFGIGADGTYTRSGQAAAFVLGVLTMFAFLPLLVVAAMLYTRSETVFAHDPARARRLVNWSWVAIGVPSAIALVVLAVVGLGALLK